MSIFSAISIGTVVFGLYALEYVCVCYRPEKSKSIEQSEANSHQNPNKYLNESSTWWTIVSQQSLRFF